ncbi:peptidoglycan recognition protein family protein [Crossiella sp. CA198]|uniref:peptidoglycan recognition protein family protein n=1 Tax=Crossiella sp. CA198 TaxID=3455607 RepID=UPI003F8D31AF
MTTRRALLTGLAGVAGAVLTGAGPAWAGSRQPPAELAAPGRPELAVRLRTRAEWGADEKLRFGPQGEVWPATFSPVQCLTVHHSAIGVGADRAAAVRSIYHGHTVAKGWGDIGYHLVIDPEGTLYQGRHTGGPAVFRQPPVNGRAETVTAGHVRGHNPGNIGICLLGDFTGGQPDPRAVGTLTRTLAALSLLCGLDPLARLNYHNVEDGQRYDGPVLARHRDWVATQCPGNAFAGSGFEPVRQEVARLVRGQRRG